MFVKVFFQDGLFADEIVFEVLFEDFDGLVGGENSEEQGFGLDGGGYVGN